MYTLEIGCHNGTSSSREIRLMEFNEKGHPLSSLDDCVALAKGQVTRWANVGYFVWFANAIAPSGEKFLNIIPPTSFR